MNANTNELNLKSQSNYDMTLLSKNDDNSKYATVIDNVRLGIQRRQHETPNKPLKSIK